MLVVYDGNNYARKVFETDTSGLGARRLFVDIAYNVTPTIVVFDGMNSKAKRRELYPGYKAQRPPTPDGFYRLLGFWKELLMHTHAVVMEVPGYEADDVIAAVAQGITSPMQIKSTDRDYLALCNEHVSVVGASMEGIPPNEIRLYKTLIGDTSDNVKGLVGFGPKEWLKLTPSMKDEIINFLKGNIEWTYPLARDSLNSWVEKNTPLLRAYWQVVGFMPVAAEDISKGTQIGVNNTPLAESKLEDVAQGSSSIGTKVASLPRLESGKFSMS